MEGTLKIVMRNEATALPRILRVVTRQGLELRKLSMQPVGGGSSLEVLLALNSLDVPLQLVRLLQKQVCVASVDVLDAAQAAG